MTVAALKPTAAEARHVGGLVGRVLVGTGALHLPAIAVAVATGEWLTVGVTSPFAPVSIKGVQIRQMWLGRLEFLAVFALAIWIGSVVRGQAELLREQPT